MTLAMKKMQGIGWVALVFMVAILLYPLSLNVASLHSDIIRVDRNILSAKKEISYLQAELRARASLTQLEEWNDLLYGYTAPSAAQYLDGERALADLGGTAPDRRPVLVSASGSLGGVDPSGTIGGGARVVASDTVSHTTSSSPLMADNLGGKRVAETAGAPMPQPAKHSDKLAGLESSLLGKGALRDIELRAAVEKMSQ